MPRNRSTIWSILIIAGLTVSVVLLFVNINFTKNNPGGNDFLVHWVGTRNLILKGVSPYSDETALDIQKIAYGRPAKPGEHELRVAYPIYSIVLFLPFALVKDFSLARAIWMTVLEIAIVALSVLSIRFVRWKPRINILMVLMVFTISWYHAIRPLINGNAIILIALGLAGALIAIRSGLDEVAGVLLALTTIKPQVVIVTLVFISLWAIMEKRWRILFWLLGTVLLLVSAGSLLIPDWILQNLREILRYPGYNPPGTIVSAMVEIFPVF